jgi:hypothetical protein
LDKAQSNGTAAVQNTLKRLTTNTIIAAERQCEFYSVENGYVTEKYEPDKLTDVRKLNNCQL